MIYTTLISRLSAGFAVVACLIGIYYWGYRNCANYYKAREAQAALQQAQQLAQAQAEASKQRDLYYASESARTAQATQIRAYRAQHKEDINKYNHINAAYVSILQHMADGTTPILDATESAGAVAVDASHVLGYTAYLYDYGVGCYNQLTALQGVVAGANRAAEGVK